VVADGSRRDDGSRAGVSEAATVDQRVVEVGAGRAEIYVDVKGDGPPLLFLHPASGLYWEDFLNRLAETYTVYAPHLPGTGPSPPQAILDVADLLDLVLLYEELVRKLELEHVPLVGISFGGMLAAELAATFPRHFGCLVLLAPIGLWHDDHPLGDWVTAPPDALPGLFFHDPESEVARGGMAPQPNGADEIAATAAETWALGCTSRFVWPVPDKGLSRRLHRIEAPTLIVWGREDALVSSEYAAEFASRIPGSEVAIVDGAGHALETERLDEVDALVRKFLAS
jgi:pimeloyl-ACP methyl ester carboxylesterase